MISLKSTGPPFSWDMVLSVFEKIVGAVYYHRLRVNSQIIMANTGRNIKSTSNFSKQEPILKDNLYVSYKLLKNYYHPNSKSFVENFDSCDTNNYYGRSSISNRLYPNIFSYNSNLHYNLVTNSNYKDKKYKHN